MEIYLIRHGQSIGNTKKGFISGRKDPSGLTNTGKSQIIRTAWELRNEKFDGIYTSPVIRAEESALIISHLLQTPVKTLEFLTELNQGIFENHYWWEVLPPDFKPDEKTNPRNNFEIPYQGGESFKMLTQRVFAGLQKLRKTQGQQKIIIVTHDAVISTLCYLIDNQLDLTKTSIIGQDFIQYIHQSGIPNAAMVRIVLKPQETPLITRNLSYTNISIDKETVSFYISGIFSLKKPLKCTNFNTASGHQVYLVKNDEEHLVKLLHGSEVNQSVHLLELYKYLDEKTTISAPIIEYFDNSQTFLSKNVLVLNYTEGENMEVCLKEHPQQLVGVQSELYNVIKKIHSLPIGQIRTFWYTTSVSQTSKVNWKLFINQAIDNSLVSLKNAPLSKTIQRRINDDLTALKTYVAGNGYQTGAIHGDLSTENIIISHKNKSCHFVKILDFERTRIGDPLWDFVYYFGWIERINEGLANEWKNIYWNELSKKHQQAFLQFRTLFHLWTVRDMQDYKNNTIRKKRGLKSLEILNSLL